MKLALQEIQKLEAEHLVATYDRMPALIVRGKGVHMYAADGTKYLDFLSGLGVNAFGYAHPAITKVIARESKNLLHTSNLFFHPYQGELAKQLKELSGMDRVFFSNTGTEAMEGAIKFARAYARANNKNGSRPKWRVLAMENAFHGRTFGSVAMTWTEKYRKPFAPVMPGVRFVKFNDVADLKKNMDASVCAIVFEPVQGEGGIRPATKEFMQAARELSTKNNALLILDEIQSGMGRTGKFFAFQHFGVKPDVVTVAKPIAGGLPLGAILTTEAVAKAIKPGMHGTTFGGGPLACAVALECIDILKRDGLLQHVKEMGSYFKRKLLEVKAKSKHVVEVRSMGLMAALEIDSPEVAKAVVKSMLEQGVVINRTHETALRFLPPFLIERKHVDEMTKKLEKALEVASAAAAPAPKKKRSKKVGN